MPKPVNATGSYRYATDFDDRYGYNNGPRSSPVLDGDRVYTVGAQGQLHCLDVRTGKLVWRRNIAAEYKVPQDFFGTASTPLVEDKLLILNAGAQEARAWSGSTKPPAAKCGARQRMGAELRVAGSSDRPR